MNHSDFFSLIKKGLPCGTFVLHGEEEYVKAQAVKAAASMIDPDLRPFNCTELEKPDPRLLSEVCETLPLFSDKRIVVCYELADGVEPAKYMDCIMDHSPETLLLLVFKGKLPSTGSIIKFAQKEGREVLFSILSPAECERWAIKRCVEAGVALDQNTARMLIGIVGTDMANLVSETDKLIDYVGSGGCVSAQDISVCIRSALDVKIFDMLDLFTYGKTADGVLALHALFDEGSEPMSVSAFLAGRFKVMLEARRGIDSKRSKQEVVSAMEGSKYANEKAYDAARRFTQAELMGLIAQLSDTAYMKISGSMREDKYIELVLLKHDWRRDPI